MFSRPSAIVLTLANLVPLAGVLWLDWQVFDVLLLYWAENAIIGVINVLRMLKCDSGLGFDRFVAAASNLTAEQRDAYSRLTGAARWFLIPFFILHYGMFCFGHLVAVVGLFGPGSVRDASELFFGTPAGVALWSPLWIGIAAITVSHLYSFRVNFVGGGEYQRTNLVYLMMRPYGRIVVLHLAVIAGGFLVTLLDSPVWMLVVLITLKISIDLRQHGAERRIFGADTE